MAVGVGGDLGSVCDASDNEVCDRSYVYDVTVGRAAINGAHVIAFQTEDVFVGKVLLGGDNWQSPHPEVIVVAEHGIPGYGRVKAGGLVGLLIIYGVGAGMGPGAR